MYAGNIESVDRVGEFVGFDGCVRLLVFFVAIGAITVLGLLFVGTLFATAVGESTTSKLIGHDDNNASQRGFLGSTLDLIWLGARSREISTKLSCCQLV